MNDLGADAFRCAVCRADDFGFVPSSPHGGHFKFPPIIGAPGVASVLFLGVNPRRSAHNDSLCRDVMASEDHFRLLAANRVPSAAAADNGPFIARDGPDSFYRMHFSIIERAFGPGPTRFEDHAALTHLMLCATDRTPMFEAIARNPCRHLFLRRTLRQVQPDVIVTVGAVVDRHFRAREPQLAYYVEYATVKSSWHIPIPHPSAHGMNNKMRRSVIDTTSRWIREILKNGEPSGNPPFAGQVVETWRRLNVDR